jgi:DNA-binding GntR family transcriptional regulator
MEPIGQRTMADNVFETVRHAILAGSFAPGSQLREAQMAAELGTSRAPLREALKRLEEEGLVVRIPFRGAFVAEVSAQAVSEIESLRVVLEPHAIEIALPVLATAAGRRELVEAVKTLAVRTREGDLAGSIESHLAVHRALYRAGGNSALFDIWQSWEAQLRLYLAVDHRSFAALTDVAKEHQRLLASIESGDLDRIRADVATHIRSPHQGP